VWVCVCVCVLHVMGVCALLVSTRLTLHACAAMKQRASQPEVGSRALHCTHSPNQKEKTQSICTKSLSLVRMASVDEGLSTVGTVNRRKNQFNLNQCSIPSRSCTSLSASQSAVCRWCSKFIQLMLSSIFQGAKTDRNHINRGSVMQFLGSLPCVSKSWFRGRVTRGLLRHNHHSHAVHGTVLSHPESGKYSAVIAAVSTSNLPFSIFRVVCPCC
jgi:hypothetical protein